MKPIVISNHKWVILLRQLHSDYPPSVLAIKEKTKRVLGFTSRVHQRWVPNSNYAEECKHAEIADVLGNVLRIEPPRGEYRQEIHLDFYNEQKRTFFILKYSEFF